MFDRFQIGRAFEGPLTGPLPVHHGLLIETCFRIINTSGRI